MTVGKALLGVLGGVAIGATMGILFAPEKGAYTRMKISKKSGKYKQELDGKFNELANNLTQKFDSMKKELTHLTENGKKKIEGVA